jgi:TPR repeat protein
MPTSPLSLPATVHDLAEWTPADWRTIVSGEPIAAAQWILHSARLGHADAQTILGQWLLNGHGLDRDPVGALAWFLKAAAQGHPMGINMAGRCFENGWGADADPFAAANWYRQAATKGLDAGMYNYANLLATGQGVKQDAAEALQWYRKAAALGHAKSMTKIGFFYEDGRVVAQDAAAAFTWFEGGARGGDFRGQYNYASMLAARGQMDEALAWLRKVPLTATPGYKRLTGEQLLQSPHPAFQAVGQQMLDALSNAVAP